MQPQSRTFESGRFERRVTACDLSQAFCQGIMAAGNGMSKLTTAEALVKAAEANNWVGSEKLLNLIKPTGSLEGFEKTRINAFLSSTAEHAKLHPGEPSDGVIHRHHKESDHLFDGIDRRLINFVRGFEKGVGKQ